VNPERFEDFANMYLIEQKTQVSKDQYDREESIVRVHLSPFFKCLLTAIGIERVTQYRTMRLHKAAPGTVKKEMSVLRHIMEKAVQYGRVDANSVKKVKFPKEPPGRVRWLDTHKEWPRLLIKLPSHMRAVVVFLVNTGCRRRETLQLKWDDVNLEQGFALVRKDKRGKTKVVPLNSAAREVLKSLPRLTDFVFPAIDEDYLSQCFREACRSAGIMNFRLHDLRHSFASELAMRGESVLTIRDLLGHSDTRMASRYSHLAASHLLRAAESVSDSFPVNPEIKVGRKVGVN
jgi:integrase